MIELPDFPWDSLRPYAVTARTHPDGIVDLSVGTPVDPTPPVIAAALSAASDSPGYPLTAGTPELRAAICAWVSRRFDVSLEPESVLPVIGTKELVALLPLLLGASRVGFPPLSYPTYDVGARIAGASPVVTASPDDVDLLWINSPANPTGAVLSSDELASVVAAARTSDTVIASDECYCDVYFDEDPPLSVLSPSVSGGSLDGLLAVHSLSKRSNLAGYRAGFVVGDPSLVARLLELRRHIGLIVPGPVQAAMVAALGDDKHGEIMRDTYRWRRDTLRKVLQNNGFSVSGDAGLYLWSTRDEPCWDTVSWLADRGILVAPGSFYGEVGAQHVRVALTATDERIAAACSRLVSS